ncbi:NAD(P)H-dependent oxidoreductase [Dactylosporangium vinaceum]|uniref:NADPH-dependent FMN reductase n=1 Tax=Dactylosporangium vinaceum TaxID=53362 RepID=A0ABV5MB60_9ACTN|nr:NAD(P)H-dependent oxidoreductase [Dactylosporangium vinaceum]UAB98335.1 NAD(P)H-dependent oxidoreductase [Dactylosporangium vinaceum]
MIVVVSGNPRPGSRTRHLADAVGAALAERIGPAKPRTVDVAELGVGLLQPGDAAVAEAVAALRGASLLVVATPTYKGSYTGVLKVLIDQLPAEGLRDIPAVTVVTAGVRPQAEAAERHLRELLGELKAALVEPGLAVTEAELADIDATVAGYVRGLALQSRG